MAHSLLLDGKKVPISPLANAPKIESTIASSNALVFETITEYKKGPTGNLPLDRPAGYDLDHASNVFDPSKGFEFISNSFVTLIIPSILFKEENSSIK